jgi:PAS domain S-box-containing protein
VRRALAGDVVPFVSDLYGTALEQHLVPQHDTAGKVTGLLGVTTDAGLLAAAAEALRAREAVQRDSAAAFRRAFDEAPTGMWLLGPDGHFLQVNRALCRMLGYTEQDLLSMDFLRLTYPEDLEVSVQIYQKLLAGEIHTSAGEKRCLHKEGRPVWCQITTSLLGDSEGNPLYFISQLQDITARKAAEQAVEEALAFADAMDRVSVALASTLDPHRLYQIILEQAMAVLPCDNAVIFLYREGWALASATLGEPTVPAGARLFPVIGPYRPWLATGRPGAVYLPDTDQEPQWVHVAPWEGERRVRSAISVPLDSGGRRWACFKSSAVRRAAMRRDTWR